MKKTAIKIADCIKEINSGPIKASRIKTICEKYGMQEKTIVKIGGYAYVLEQKAHAIRLKNAVKEMKNGKLNKKRLDRVAKKHGVKDNILRNAGKFIIKRKKSK